MGRGLHCPPGVCTAVWLQLCGAHTGSDVAGERGAALAQEMTTSCFSQSGFFAAIPFLLGESLFPVYHLLGTKG